MGRQEQEEAGRFLEERIRAYNEYASAQERARHRRCPVSFCTLSSYTSGWARPRTGEAGGGSLRSGSGVDSASVWGILLAYNLVRVEMERAADEAGVEPTRISFVNALSMIRNAWIVWSTPPLAPGRIPEHLLDLRRHLGLLLLPERRPEPRYPRVVKIKMSNYDKKWVKRPLPN